MDDNLTINRQKNKTITLQQQEPVQLQAAPQQVVQGQENINEPSPQEIRERLYNDVVNDTKWYGDSDDMVVIKNEIESLRKEQAKGENADPKVLLLQYDYMIRLTEKYLSGREKKKSMYGARHRKVKALCDSLKSERAELLFQDQDLEVKANAELHSMSMSRARRQDAIRNDAERLEELLSHPIPMKKESFHAEKREILGLYDKMIAHFRKESDKFCILEVAKKKRRIAGRVMLQFEKERKTFEKKHFLGEKTTRTWNEDLSFTNQAKIIDTSYLEQNPGVKVIMDTKKDDAYGIISRLVGEKSIFTLAERKAKFIDISGDETDVTLSAERRGFTLEEAIEEAKDQDLPLMYSDKAMEQLETTQIIDFIMGQTNRTQDSFEVKVEIQNVENVDYLVITDVMVRGHEACLGGETADDLNKEMPGLSTRKIFDQDDNLALSGYSYSVADKIIALDENALAQSFRNVGVSEEAVGAMLGRLKKTKTLLEKDKASGKRSKTEKNPPRNEEERIKQRRNRITKEAANTYILSSLIQDVGNNFVHAENMNNANDKITELSKINKKTDKYLKSEAPVLEKRRRINGMIEADKKKYEGSKTKDVLDALSAYMAMDYSTESYIAADMNSKNYEELLQTFEPGRLEGFMKKAREQLGLGENDEGDPKEIRKKFQGIMEHEEGSTVQYYFNAKKRKLNKVRELIRERMSELSAINERSNIENDELDRLKTYLDELTLGMSGNLVYDKAKTKVVDDSKFTDKVYFVSRKDEELFAEDPKITDLIQGNVGDCYLIASLASVVEYDPQFIKDHMKDNGDGTVTVKVFKPTNKSQTKFEPVTVTVEKTAGYNKSGPLFTAGAHGALWVQLYEKALVAVGVTDKHKKNTKYQYTDLTSGKEFWSLGWILGSKAEILFDAEKENGNKTPEFKYKDKKTGKIVYKDSFNRTVETLKKKMQEMLDKGAIVSAAAFQKFKGATGSGGFGEGRRRGMASKHAYTVLGMEEIDGKTFVRVRNPWGTTISETVMNELTGKVFYAEGKGSEAEGSFLMDISSFAEHIQRVSYVLKSKVDGNK